MAANRQVMTVGQLLNPDIIYRFNACSEGSAAFGQETDYGRHPSISGPVVIPVFVSKATRTAHWIAVDPTLWQWSEHGAQAELKGLCEKLCHLKLYNKDAEGEEQKWSAGWKAFVSDVPQIGSYAQAHLEVESYIAGRKRDIGESLHSALLALYAGYHQGIRKNIEGVLYRFLEAHCVSGHAGPYHLAGTLKRRNKDTSWEWFVPDVEEGFGACGCIVPCESLVDDIPSQNEEDPFVKLLNKSNATQGASHVAVQRAIAEELLRCFLLRPREKQGIDLRELQYALLLPMFDEEIDGEGYGGIKAIFLLLFRDRSDAKGWMAEDRNNLQRFTDEFRGLAQEITQSAQTLALSSHIEPPYDLVRHFLKILRYVQDWESVMVFANGRFSYGYRRVEPIEGAHKWEWPLCPLADILQFPDRELTIQNEEIQQGTGGRRYIWWTNGNRNTTNLWSQALIPSIGDEETLRFENLTFRFEFPKAARLPPFDSTASAALRQAYLRQQLEVMRRLLPDVRARRSALRNAAVSIMARNMSHNIGSHVLVAARREIEQAEEAKKSELLGDISKLQAHLQRRMDFIAEMATVESFYSPIHTVFSEVLGFKELGDQTGKWGISIDGAGFAAQKLLLKHITGKDGVAMTLDPAGDHGDVPFACSGGTLGWQAFYVILENVIRNVVKHCDELEGQEVKLRLRVLDGATRELSDFWEVRIWDLCKSAFSHEEAEEDTAERPKIGATIRLVDRINKDFFDATKRSPRYPRLIDGDGRMERERWGLKEMYICAAYLREVALADLESERPLDEPPAILKAIAVNDSGDEEEAPENGSQKRANLGYCFYLPKPKLLAVIVDNSDALLETLREKRQVLAKDGVEVMSQTDFATRHARPFRAVRHRDVAWLCNADGNGGSKTASTSAADEHDVWDARLRGLLPPCVLRKSELCGRDESWNNFEKELRKWLSDVQGEKAVNCARTYFLTCMGSDRGLNAAALKVWFLQVGGQAPNEGDIGGFLGKKLITAALFDYHGHIEKEAEDEQEQGETESKQVKTTGFFPDKEQALGWASKLAFYERFPSLSPQKPLFENVVSKWTKEGKCNELEYSQFQYVAACGVIILDERVQRSGNDVAPQGYRPDGKLTSALKKGYRLVSCLERMRIFVPSKEMVDLDSPDSGKICAWLTSQFDRARNGPKIGFLVIHQGIIDGINEGEVFKDALLRLVNDNRCTLVLCSGRGVPPQAYRKTSPKFWPRFVPVSALLDRVVTNPSKYHLISLLEGSRAPNN